MKVISVNISDRKGIPKTPVDEIKLIPGGIVGDAHFAPGKREVSLLAKESYDRFEKLGLGKVCLKHGIFGENIVTEGIELHTMNVGTKMKIGDALLEVTQIGKECHAPCHIARTVGSCIMPNEGIFVKVLEKGIIKSNDCIEISKIY